MRRRRRGAGARTGGRCSRGISSLTPLCWQLRLFPGRVPEDLEPHAPGRQDARHRGICRDRRDGDGTRSGCLADREALRARVGRRGGSRDSRSEFLLLWLRYIPWGQRGSRSSIRCRILHRRGGLAPCHSRVRVGRSVIRPRQVSRWNALERRERRHREERSRRAGRGPLIPIIGMILRLCHAGTCRTGSRPDCLPVLATPPAQAHPQSREHPYGSQSARNQQPEPRLQNRADRMCGGRRSRRARRGRTHGSADVSRRCTRRLIERRWRRRAGCVS
ncbi:hypothetical protein Mnod_8549 (plasmid) [Methylobacterium nodulans ORS 2060]|uniref:Uncharacterized protein n=1 Tax=Methylobacterium nodulans (strain LMG 21967 / CNCM I-2342 / ORS 2060) TaxID=460265 RepID=B8IW49_METNO|nr:hypothetical protein Mnod_8549 [Methylobacterium nodulans ORS 2060]